MSEIILTCRKTETRNTLNLPFKITHDTFGIIRNLFSATVSRSVNHLYFHDNFLFNYSKFVVEEEVYEPWHRFTNLCEASFEILILSPTLPENLAIF